MSGSRMFISVIVHDNKYAPFTKDVTDQEKLEIKKLGNLCTIPYKTHYKYKRRLQNSICRDFATKICQTLLKNKYIIEQIYFFYFEWKESPLELYDFSCYHRTPLDHRLVNTWLETVFHWTTFFLNQQNNYFPLIFIVDKYLVLNKLI